MTLIIAATKQFEKDLLRVKKRGKELSKLTRIIGVLANGEKLPIKHRNHKLVGNFKDRFECHIEPDWLLIYFIDDKMLKLERTGTHADLF